MSTFEALGLAEPICRALQKHQYTEPTPIQVEAIPALLQKQDLFGISQTGTGKTAAFALPILQHLFENKKELKPRKVRALILTSTRELVVQIAAQFRKYGAHLGLKNASIFGGVSQSHQVKAVADGVDYIVATPGRLVDLVKQGHVDLSEVHYLVLDEADRMLDIGFIHDIRKIVSLVPKERQTLLFSATMPETVLSLAKNILKNPQFIEVTPESITVEKIQQSVYHIEKKDKRALLLTKLQNPTFSKTIVFSKTKHGANRIGLDLEHAGIKASVLHGNKSQTARQVALEDFKKGRTSVLVATDIAARGIDVRDVSHVINYDLPNEPESYVHRIGRTARAGADGVAYSFCDETEKKLLRTIEKLIKFNINVAESLELGTFSLAPRRKAANSTPFNKGSQTSAPKHDSQSKDHTRKPSHKRKRFKGRSQAKS